MESAGAISTAIIAVLQERYHFLVLLGADRIDPARFCSVFEPVSICGRESVSGWTGFPPPRQCEFPQLRWNFHDVSGPRIGSCGRRDILAIQAVDADSWLADVSQIDHLPWESGEHLPLHQTRSALAGIACGLVLRFPLQEQEVDSPRRSVLYGVSLFCRYQTRSSGHSQWLHHSVVRSAGFLERRLPACIMGRRHLACPHAPKMLLPQSHMNDHPVRDLIHEVGELEQEALPPDSALPSLAIPEISTAKLIVFQILFYVVAFGIRASFLEGPGLISLFKHFIKPENTLAHRPSILFDFFLYMTVACQFFPLPSLPPIAGTARLFPPVIVAVVGALGTCIANLNDYAILGMLFRHHKVRKIRDIHTYRRLLNFFDRYSFLTLSCAAFLPLPIDPIRLLAISRAYPYWKYIGATFVGRFPRYLLLAYLAKELPWKYVLVLFAVLSLPPLIKLISDIIRKRRHKTI